MVVAVFSVDFGANVVILKLILLSCLPAAAVIG
jgi:hypothetical protein